MQTPEKKQTFWQVITLYFLAPICGELLSSSAPPVEFFTPFGLVIMSALYGSGALLMRELVRRWGKGWASLFLLGLAYGIYEEGIVVRSFFDPAWPDLDILAVYGRALGVNWVWALMLSLYHATVSTVVPILLVELLFPAKRDHPWLGRGGLFFFTVLFLLLIPFGLLIGMQASFLALAGCVLAMGVLALLAYTWPMPAGSAGEPRWVAAPTLVFAAGFAGMIILVLLMWVAPALGLSVGVTLLAGGLLPAGFTALLYQMGAEAWGERQQWALAAGALGVWVLLAFTAAASNATRPDDTTGMGWVGLAFILFLGGLGVAVWRRTRRVLTP